MKPEVKTEKPAPTAEQEVTTEAALGYGDCIEKYKRAILGQLSASEIRQLQHEARRIAKLFPSGEKKSQLEDISVTKL